MHRAGGIQLSLLTRIGPWRNIGHKRKIGSQVIFSTKSCASHPSRELFAVDLTD